MSKNVVETINKIKEFIKSEEDKYCYRTLDAISQYINMDKVELLKILVRCQDFVVHFPDNKIDYKSGPFFGLKTTFLKKEKELKNKKIKQDNEQKEQESKPNSTKNNKLANKKRIKNFTKKVIEIHDQFDELMQKYSTSLRRNDENISNDTLKCINDLRKIIAKLIQHNNYSKDEFEK